MEIIPLRVAGQLLPESGKILIMRFKDFHFILRIVIGAMVVIKGKDAAFAADPVKASPAFRRADIEIEFLGHKDKETGKIQIPL